MLRRAALAALLLTTAAFVPTPADEPALVTTGKPVRVHRTLSALAPSARARLAFAALAQAGWEAQWDAETGVPLRIAGSYVAAPGSVADPAIAEQAARAFLAAHVDLLAPGSTPADFVLAGNQLDTTGIRTVGFAQAAGGVRVIGGQLGFVFAHDRLFAIGSEALPDVHVTPVQAHAVDVRATERWLRGATVKPTGERAILPLVRGGSVTYALVDVVTATAPQRLWDVYVGMDGTPVARASKLHFAGGTLAYNAGVRYATGARMDYPAREVGLTANNIAATTGIDGSFPFTGTSATVAPGLTGLRVTMVNAAGALATTSFTVADGNTATWNDAATELVDAQLSTYVYGNLIKARDRVINPSIAAWIDQPLDFHVNEADTCNAFSTGNDVHFFHKGGGCENTGRIADVVFHEFGHSFHNHSALPGMGSFETNLSEGLADFNAANFTEDPGIGRGFDFTDNPSRQIDPVGTEAVYPRDLNADPHVSGLIISGALWDLRKAAIRVMGHDAGVQLAEKVFAGVAMRAADIGSSYTAALIADDDDGNLGNGTPHGCMIAAAFAPHGLVQNFVTTSVGTPVMSGLAVTVPIMRPASGTCVPPMVASATLTWQVGDGPTSDVALTAAGETYVGAIPAQPANTLVTYSILVTLDNGAAYVFPDNAADPKYQLFVGTTTPLYCAMMDVDPKWTPGGTTTSRWLWAPPGLDTNSPDPLAAHTGDHVLGINVAVGGKYASNEMTQIQAPAIAVDTTLYDRVHLQYWRWLTVERSMYDTATIAINGTPAWTNSHDLEHVDKEWRFHDLDVTGMPSVQVAWTLASDDSQEYGGWVLDDVCLVGIGKHPLCGDGIVDDGETCDDGNTVGGDGCSAACETETDGGGCCSAQRDPAGAVLLALGLAFAWRKPRRRRALISRC